MNKKPVVRAQPVANDATPPTGASSSHHAPPPKKRDASPTSDDGSSSDGDDGSDTGVWFDGVDPALVRATQPVAPSTKQAKLVTGTFNGYDSNQAQ